MNDNLRYISLQYIKGDNYEEIICFNYDALRRILEDRDSFRKDISNNILNELNDAIDKDSKCYIGESFLNDLVNYYNFKDIKNKIKDVRRDVEDYKKSLNRTGEDANEAIRNAKNARSDIIKSLKELVEVLKDKNLKIDNIGQNMMDTNNDAAKTALSKYNEVKRLYNRDTSLFPFHDIPDDGNRKPDLDINDVMTNIEDAINGDNNTKEHTNIKNAIISGINKIIASNAGQKYDLIKLLLTLRKLFLYENEQEGLKGQVETENADKLLVLFKTYTKICNRNIGKFDRLFKQNDIVDIDEAFMIESYASFLNKLKKLKKNLESKDKGKLERALTNSLTKLFNLYGINDYEKILNSGDETVGTDAQNYIKKLIDDY
jgi:hypothetical protein